MTNTAKIVFIGAGSMCFGLTMFRDIFFAEKLLEFARDIEELCRAQP